MSEKKDPLGNEKAVVLRSCNLTLETTQYLEEKLRESIREGNLGYADLLSVKTVLDCNYKALCELQEIDQRMRRLMCLDEFDISQGKRAVAFFDKREVSE